MQIPFEKISNHLTLALATVGRHIWQGERGRGGGFFGGQGICYWWCGEHDVRNRKEKIWVSSSSSLLNSIYALLICLLNHIFHTNEFCFANNLSPRMHSIACFVDAKHTLKICGIWFIVIWLETTYMSCNHENLTKEPFLERVVRCGRAEFMNWSAKQGTRPECWRKGLVCTFSCVAVLVCIELWRNVRFCAL